MLKAIFKNSSYLLVSQFFVKALAFFYAIFLAGNVGAADFGTYSAALSIFGLVSLFSDLGIYAASIFSGVANIDAITITMSQLGGSHITLNVAAIAITLAVVINMIFKTVISYIFGSRKFANRIAISTGITLFAGLVAFSLI